jgi:DNA-binding MarR family transcriptional regulator
MSNTQVIADLLSKFQAYETEHKKVSVDDFAVWLLKQNRETKLSAHLGMGSQNKYANKKVDEADNAVGFLLGLLNKYAKHYSKIALSQLPINSIEEFGYLAHLSTHQHLTKTELINVNLDGKTTGTDIIRRLIELGLVKEMSNPDDKRSKLIKINDKGKKVITEAYRKMGQVSKMVVGNLTPNEKQTLIKIMSKLEDYHKLNEPVLTDILKTSYQQY